MLWVTVICCFPASVEANAIRIHGSDTLLILSQEWVAEYREEHPDLSILVIGGGSELGIEALLKGETQIAAASRPLRAEEKRKIENQYGSPPLEVPVALDGIAIYVHETNPVHHLSLEKLKGIYTGRIRNWAEVGGADRPIQLVSRNADSGTTTFFRKHVLEGEAIASDAQFLGTTSAVATMVSRSRDAIGFGGVAYASGSRIVRLSSVDTRKPIWPSQIDVASGLYPLSRSLYYYIHPEQKEDPQIMEFLQWVYSERAQIMADALNYYPLPAKAREAFPWKK